MRVDELIALGGALPPPPNSLPQAETVNEIVRLYYEIYATGLTSFFETQWYELSRDGQPGATNTISVLRDNRPVMDLFSAFLEAIKGVKSREHAQMVYSGHLETGIVWALARLPESAVPVGSVYQPGQIPPDNDAAETRSRLHVLEMLLSGDTLSANPLTQPPHMSAVRPEEQVRVHELEFWYALAEYLVEAHSPAQAQHAATRETQLGRMRAVLDGRENRDVLYSIAVLREYTMQFDAAQAERTAPTQLDEKDPRSKLAVATRFIQDQASKTGTTNVVRRFADLAYRAFVQPGGNVRRAHT